MNSKHKTPNQCWLQVHAAARNLQGATISGLFQADPCRTEKMQAEGAGVVLDYSKSLLDEPALLSLQALFESANLAGKLIQQIQGETVNCTEGRPALHTAVRAATLGDETPYSGFIATEYQRCSSFAQSLFNGTRRGYSGAAITDVVNLGIGGSDLGPRMATSALADYCSGKTRVHYVSSLDDSDFRDTVEGLEPSQTLFLVSSKSFSTEETLTNAHLAINWFLASRPAQELSAHFAAITGKTDQAAELGIARELIFTVPDWIGGRYSIWSSCGLGLMIAIGAAGFEQFLRGAYEMDTHVAHSEFRQNLAALMAAIEIWHRNCLGYGALAVIPYSYRLRQLPAYLQQLVMESNGKSITRMGQPVALATSPLLWGTAGTDGQHSYHQLLHQGTDTIPVDFILPLGSGGGSPESQRKLASHCLAQSKALMEGWTPRQATEEMLAQGLSSEAADRLAPHHATPGNRPSNTLVLRGLKPATLGALIALYEHKTFFTSALWDINPFDQWGVELGKRLSRAIQPAVEGVEPASFDASTNALINLAREHRQTEQEATDE